MYKKGDLSLDLIVKFVILSITALVVIGTFLQVWDRDITGGETVDREQMEINCQQLCGSWESSTGEAARNNAFEYCTERFVHDFTGDGSINNIAGAGTNSFCEDGIRCFNVIDCESDRGEKLDAERCIDVMCEHYQDEDVTGDLLDDEIIVERIYEWYEPGVAEGKRGLGTCGLEEAEDEVGQTINTWYHQNIGINNIDELDENDKQEEFEEICE